MPTTNQRTYRKKINVNIIQPKSRQPQIANWIAGISALISLGLGIITLLLFFKSSKQTEAAIKADSIAERSYKLSDSIYKSTDATNKLALIETKRVNDSTIKENRKRSIRDSLSLNAQLQTIRETKQEFEIEHQPFLEVTRINNIHLADNEEISFDYDIYNSSEQVVKEIDHQFMMAIFPKRDSLEFTKNPFKHLAKLENSGTHYIMKEVPSQLYFTNNDKIPIGLKNAIVTGKTFVCFVGIIRYTNNVKKNPRLYRFAIRLRFDAKGKVGYTPVFSENRDQVKSDIK